MTCPFTEIAHCWLFLLTSCKGWGKSPLLLVNVCPCFQNYARLEFSIHLFPLCKLFKQKRSHWLCRLKQIRNICQSEECQFPNAGAGSIPQKIRLEKTAWLRFAAIGLHHTSEHPGRSRVCRSVLGTALATSCPK